MERVSGRSSPQSDDVMISHHLPACIYIRPGAQTITTTMSLLQDVLRSYNNNPALRSQANDTTKDDSDDDVVNVVSAPGTPGQTRPSSPTGRGSAQSRQVRPLFISSSQRDPLRRFPTEVSQRIFTRLSVPDLAKCALVSKKWSRSQTLNYGACARFVPPHLSSPSDAPFQVWFQHYRKENFHDETLPPGKWTKRESKQNWVRHSHHITSTISLTHPPNPQRTVYTKMQKDREPPMVLPRSSSRQASRQGSRAVSPNRSGYQTPRELKEEQWRQEAQAAEKPGKLEMREMYKELGGRKSRGKAKLGATGGTRDRGGWDDGGGDDW